MLCLLATGLSFSANARSVVLSSARTPSVTMVESVGGSFVQSRDAIDATGVKGEQGKVVPNGSAPTDASAPAAAAPRLGDARKLVDVAPIKAMALMRVWQSKIADQNKVTTVPEDGENGQKLKVVRAWTPEEVDRRALCKKDSDVFVRATMGLAEADKSDQPEAKRQLVKALELGGAARGVGTKVFASVGGGATSLSLVEALPESWQILSLCINPEAREVPAIVDAEAATLQALSALALEAGAKLRVLAAVEPSLAGTQEQLGLAPSEDGWFDVTKDGQ